eukprot:Lithocolla_globosa_v1_NODE_345_length_4393_cov_6.676349.p4 type:complete len:125 gc:universal NODE_345_length_4393_cov_6.676349:3107-2733(-)
MSHMPCNLNSLFLKVHHHHKIQEDTHIFALLIHPQPRRIPCRMHSTHMGKKDRIICPCNYTFRQEMENQSQSIRSHRSNCDHYCRLGGYLQPPDNQRYNHTATKNTFLVHYMEATTMMLSLSHM